MNNITENKLTFFIEKMKHYYFYLRSNIKTCSIKVCYPRMHHV